MRRSCRRRTVSLNIPIAIGGLCLFVMGTTAGVSWTPSETALIQSLSAPNGEAKEDDGAQREARFGQLLFWDKRLSGSGARSCASCHNPRFGWSDGRRLPRGGGQRHTPTLWNVASNEWFFWDGRSDSLAAQALHPIESSAELNGSRQSVAALIAGDQALRASYERSFGTFPRVAEGTSSGPAVDCVFANVGRALAALERRIVSVDSRFDRFAGAIARGEAPPDEFTPSAQRGLRLFIGRAGCICCHRGPSLSDGQFHNTGLAGAAERADANAPSGNSMPPSPDALALTRRRAEDLERLARERRARGEFRTPTLRNIAETSPYMHDGRFSTLDEVLAYYSTLDGASFDGLGDKPSIRPLRLSEGERTDLIAFLNSLTGTLAEARWGLPPRAATMTTIAH